MKNLTDELVFPCGARMKNRFMLAPMTNQQSHEDGTLSDEEYRWLTMRAKGGFGLVMTCASHVHKEGKGFPGQLGIFEDKHIEGHQRLSDGIKKYGSLAVIQLHHAGMRSPENLIKGRPVCPSDNAKTGARALSLEEVYQLRDDFIVAAIRSYKAGYDGIEVHGAHGYILCQFLSSEINFRTDEYGGSLENRARIIFEIVDGIREACGDDFLVGVRLSPEKFGMQLEEIKLVTQSLVNTGQVDFMDISLWDCFKMPEGDLKDEKSLLSHFEEIDFKNVLFTVAGKIRTGKEVHSILDSKVDFVSIGRSGILHHDFPNKVIANKDFEPIPNPVGPSHLRQEGLSDKFVTYMRRWPEFVEA